MNRNVHLLQAILLAASLPAAAPPQEGDLPWTVEQMAADLRQAADAVRTEWAYYELRRGQGLDMDALLARSLEDVEGIRTAEDFARILHRFVAALKDGHGGAVLAHPSPPRRFLPLALVACREGVLVLHADPGAGEEGPRRGDLLVALDSRPVEEWLAALEETVPASTPGARRLQALRELHRTPARRVQCTLRGEDGATRTVEVPTLAAPLPGAVRAPAAAAPVEAGRLAWPRPDVALWQIRSFAVPRWQEWLAAPVEERDAFLEEGRAAIEKTLQAVVEGEARALILDLRGNGGGTDLLGIHLAEGLLAGRFRYFLLSSKVRGRWTRPSGFTYGRNAARVRFAGKLLALVDEDCFSVTDNLLRCLRDLHPDFTVVGRPTGGGTGAPRPIAHLQHSGAQVILCTIRVLGPNRAPIEGAGTVPDLLVTRSRADWLSGRDPELDAALALLDPPDGR